ncbi:lysozyme inhibitor LprI family protein [Acinetobacter faecalis]|uniref:lysozyme inhibitor LprI family protein n=1 Tax=Acinetobacter faecalis TaxID=2665161 RepID=UPI002A920064|nr:lysozyme inhibitor LprI family protein [Acinetobacter faecalis]MDY6469120.1 lysozyme inhibitor LprI family protein [Acinetobacter faecalis]
MKKLLLISALLFSGGVWADCNNPKTSHEIQKCLSDELTALKKELNVVYGDLYKQTQAKRELDSAQKAWLKYKDLQCGDFTIADSGYGSGQIAYDLACQADLTEQRISFLKNQTN